MDLNPVSHSYQPLVQHRLAQWSAAAVEFQERHVCTQHKTKTKRKNIQKGNSGLATIPLQSAEGDGYSVYCEHNYAYVANANGQSTLSQFRTLACARTRMADRGIGN